MALGWKRDTDAGLTRTIRLTDGEWTRRQLLARGLTDATILSESYSVFAKLNDARGKAMVSMAVASFVLVLAYFDMVGESKLLGISVKAAFFDVLALFLVSVVTLNFSAIDSKYSLYQAVYLLAFKAADCDRRAEYLLRYPDAFSMLTFSRFERGFPRTISPASLWSDFALPLLLLLSIGAGLLILLLLSVLIAIDIWQSPAVPPMFAKGTVVIAAIASIIVLLMPRHQPWRRTYIHYGLVQRLDALSRRDPERCELRHRQIAAARLRSGWTPPSEEK